MLQGQDLPAAGRGGERRAGFFVRDPRAPLARFALSTAANENGIVTFHSALHNWNDQLCTRTKHVQSSVAEKHRRSAA